MSDLIVPVTRIESIERHPNADRLDIAHILGWQVIVGRDNWKVGDKVMYVPPDALVPTYWAEKWGVADYLHSCSKEGYGRVKPIKLRGEPSFGFAVPIKYTHDGTNVATRFGIEKYEPPEPGTHGGRNAKTHGQPVHPLLQGYTSIENLRNYPDLLEYGEPVMITEKIHGANSRVAMIEGQLIVGSHKRQWARPENEADVQENWFWYPATLEPVLAALDELSRDHRQVILYGETFGRVQSLHYGNPSGLSWAAFDLLLDGKYLDAFDFAIFCDSHQIPMVPLMEIHTPWSKRLIESYAFGPSALDTHVREGFVVRPMRERHHPKLGRVILKYVSDEYLTSKHKDHEVSDAG